MTTDTGVKQKRILVVEDDQGVSRMLGLVLRSAGFDVASVHNGGQALRFLATQPADAVVLDLGLPDGLGGEVLQWLRQQAASPNGPAWVAISALDAEEVHRRHGAIGDHFLAKPFDPWRLVSMLRALMAERERLAADGHGSPKKE
jgi:DNA-binding response OmpR family regulator